MLRFLQTNGEFAYINPAYIRAVIGLEKYYSEITKVSHPKRTEIKLGFGEHCTSIVVNETPEEVFDMIHQSQGN